MKLTWDHLKANLRNPKNVMEIRLTVVGDMPVIWI